MARPIPRMIRCKATVGGQPVAGLVMRVVLRTDFKNDYDIVFGPTCDDGTALLSSERIQDEAKKQMNEAIMDYGPLENTFTGAVQVGVLSRERLDDALAAVKVYGVWRYPAGYRRMLKYAHKLLESVSIEDVRLEVAVQPEDIRVETGS